MLPSEKLNSFSLVIPAYNESSRILPTLKNYDSFLKKKFKRYEIIVVCNNCTDDTFSVCQKFAKTTQHIHVFNFPYYTGKGGAVIEGFKVARFELVGFVDADRSTAPAEFGKLLDEIPFFDAAVASRDLKTSKVDPPQPFFRHFQGLVFRSLVQLLFRIPVLDTQCGAKTFRKSVLKKVIPVLHEKGWAFDVELLWRLHQSHARIKEVGIRWQNDDQSRVGMFSGVKMLHAILKLRFGFK